jgi:hypothetical protein
MSLSLDPEIAEALAPMAGAIAEAIRRGTRPRPGLASRCP